MLGLEVGSGEFSSTLVASISLFSYFTRILRPRLALSQAQIKNRPSEDGSNELILRYIKDVMYPLR